MCAGCANLNKHSVSIFIQALHSGGGGGGGGANGGHLNLRL